MLVPLGKIGTSIQFGCGFHMQICDSTFTVLLLLLCCLSHNHLWQLFAMCYNCVYCVILNHSHLECSQSLALFPGSPSPCTVLLGFNGHDIIIVRGEGEPGYSQSHTLTILPQSELKKCEDEEKRRELKKEIRECDEVMIANLMP